MFENARMFESIPSWARYLPATCKFFNVRILIISLSIIIMSLILGWLYGKIKKLIHR